MIELAKIKIDGGTQARAELNHSVVSEYAEIYKAGGHMPAVVVFFDGSEFWLADGFHRFFGAKQAGKTEILEERMLGTKRDAVLYSLSANAKHGLRRTNEDKRRAVMTMLNDSEWAAWSDSAIARACGVSDKTVSAHRASSEIPKIEAATTFRIVERNGKTYEQNTANIGKAKNDTVSHMPVQVAEPEYDPTEDNAKEQEDLVRTLADEVDSLTVRLALNDNGATEEEKAHAIDVLARIKSLEIENRALIASRDSFMRENAELKIQLSSQRRQIKKLTGDHK